MNDRSKFIYPFLIFFIWLITFLTCSLFIEKRFEWDECKYLACARGIAENLDFSSRSTTVEGLIKYGFPQHTTHYPLNSLYIAAFFKSFGTSLDVAYFATWFSVLITCMFIYFTLLLFTRNNYLFSFMFAISFLFFPRMIFKCHSAMMEMPGCALISILIFFIFKGLSKSKLNPIFLACAFMLLYFYKSLFVGLLFGFIIIILSSCYPRLVGLDIKNKLPVCVNLILFFGVVAILYFIFSKFVFLPLGPWLVFSPDQSISGDYADFSGGFLKDPLHNLQANIKFFFDRVIFSYYPFFINYFPDNEASYYAIPAWYELAFYFLAFFYTTLISIISWRKLEPIQRVFISFTIVSIIFLNLIFVLLFSSGVGPLCRYNLIYTPLLLISFAIVALLMFKYVKPFVLEHKIGSILVFISFIFLCYVPLFYSAFLVTNWNRKFYDKVAHKNSLTIKKFIGNSNPMFIYSTGGSHITWDLFPTREIFMDATSDQIKKINSILPKPIEYLFLSPGNLLFRQNQDLILKKQPIIDNWYTFYGVDPQNQVVVYKLQ